MSEPIRILHMIGSLNVGGSQSMIINLHRAIDKSRVQFDYIIDHPGHLYYADIVKELGGQIYEMPTFTGKKFFKVRKAWKNFFAEHPEYRILHSHVRVDFYNINGKIIFGEMIFFNASGYVQFVPDSFDFELGHKMSLEKYVGG